MNGTKNIVILQDGGSFRIVINGRANFEYGRDLREELTQKKLVDGNTAHIQVDLSGCSGMDSTFMGILAMLALDARKFSIEVRICDNKQHNINLLEDLGIAKLFKIEQCDEHCACGQEIAVNRTGTDKELATAEAVVDAHQTLMDVDERNKAKFNVVVDMAKQDLEKVKAKKAKEEKP